MSFRYKKPLQTITLFLVICVANGYVFAFLPGGNTVGTTQPKALTAGVLNAFDASSVLVNGNTAQDGMTILSDAEIKTNQKGGATINLRQLGKIELNAETAVKLVFTADQVNVQVIGGQATLTTFKGVSGVLTDANGKALKTDSSRDVSSVGSGEAAAADVPVPVPPVAAPGLFGLGVWGTAAVVGGVVGGTVLALAAAVQADDNSDAPVSRVRP